MSMAVSSRMAALCVRILAPHATPATPRLLLVTAATVPARLLFAGEGCLLWGVGGMRQPGLKKKDKTKKLQMYINVHLGKISKNDQKCSKSERKSRKITKKKPKSCPKIKNDTKFTRIGQEKHQFQNILKIFMKKCNKKMQKKVKKMGKIG